MFAFVRPAAIVVFTAAREGEMSCRLLAIDFGLRPAPRDLSAPHAQQRVGVAAVLLDGACRFNLAACLTSS